MIRGTIFNQNYPFTHFRLHEVDSTTQWTPSKEDMELAEKILRKQVKKLNKKTLPKEKLPHYSSELKYLFQTVYRHTK